MVYMCVYIKTNKKYTNVHVYVGLASTSGAYVFVCCDVYSIGHHIFPGASFYAARLVGGGVWGGLETLLVSKASKFAASAIACSLASLP